MDIGFYVESLSWPSSFSSGVQRRSFRVWDAPRVQIPSVRSVLRHSVIVGFGTMMLDKRVCELVARWHSRNLL